MGFEYSKTSKYVSKISIKSQHFVNTYHTSIKIADFIFDANIREAELMEHDFTSKTEIFVDQVSNDEIFYYKCEYDVKIFMFLSIIIFFQILKNSSKLD